LDAQGHYIVRNLTDYILYSVKFIMLQRVFIGDTYEIQVRRWMFLMLYKIEEVLENTERTLWKMKK